MTPLPILMLASAMLANDGPAPKVDPAVDSPPPWSAGLRAYADPSTGRLLDAPPEATPPFPELMPRNFDLMWEEYLPDGTIILHHEGQMQMATVARVADDGALETQCLPGSEPHRHAGHEASMHERAGGEAEDRP